MASDASDRMSMIEHHAHLSKNREVFLLNYGLVFRAFDTIGDRFTAIRQVLKSGRDQNNKTHVGLVPGVYLMQRQTMMAFECLTVYQSYEAWVQLRPCLEMALMMGKWIDDFGNYTIWKDKDKDRKKYIDTYTGKKLQSLSLPRSADFQTVLSGINDDFMHTNLDYYLRHIVVEPNSDGTIYNVGILFMDDADTHETAMLALLHLLVVLQDALADMFHGVLPTTAEIPAAVPQFEASFGTGAQDLIRRCPDSKAVLQDRGLWSGL